MALKYPDLTFIAAHMELITDNEFAIKVVTEVPNIFGDTAWVKPDSTLKTISKAGIEKIMFGTDNPVDGYETLNHPFYKTYLGPGFKRKLGAAKYHRFMGINAAIIYNVH
jgi:predicted TIM-barrel fold metal-dependent hydrolase